MTVSMKYDISMVRQMFLIGAWDFLDSIKWLPKVPSSLIIFYTIRHFRQKPDIGYT